MLPAVSLPHLFPTVLHVLSIHIVNDTLATVSHTVRSHIATVPATLSIAVALPPLSHTFSTYELREIYDLMLMRQLEKS